jgi:hypothetical protein
MAHCGYEPTAADQAISNPLTALWTAIKGIRTTGPMAPEIPLAGQRRAEFVFSSHVDKMLAEIHAKPAVKKPVRAEEAAPAK